jgi:hypothetical protein
MLQHQYDVFPTCMTRVNNMSYVEYGIRIICLARAMASTRVRQSKYFLQQEYIVNQQQPYAEQDQPQATGHQEHRTHETDCSIDTLSYSARTQ